MFVKLHKINKNQSGEYYLSDVRVNVSHIVFISENTEMLTLLREGKLNLNLNPAIRFSDVLVSSRTTASQKMTVVGEPDFIESKINSSPKQLLMD